MSQSFFFILLLGANDLFSLNNDFSKWYVNVTFYKFGTIYVYSSKYEGSQRTNEK